MEKEGSKMIERMEMEGNCDYKEECNCRSDKKQTDFLPGRKLVPSSPQYLEISGTEISLQSPCQCM